MEKLLVLDTNVYLHAKFFTEIAWNELVKVDDVVLLLPPVVLKELEKHKYGTKAPRVRERAAQVVRKLVDLLEHAEASESPQVRPGVRLRQLLNRPKLPEGFDPHDQDDELIASCLEVKSTGVEVTLVALDGAARLKAKRHGVERFRLPEGLEEDRSEPDPAKKELAQLKKVPRPELRTTLRFGETELINGEPGEVCVRAVRAPTDAELTLRANRQLIHLERQQGELGRAWNSEFRTLAREEETRQLDRFRQAAASAASSREEQGRRIDLVVEIQNVGTAPATRVVIENLECDCDVGQDLQEWAQSLAGRDALLQTQTWASTLTLEIPRGFNSRVVTLAVRVLASEFPEPLVTLHRFRIREVPAAPFDDG